MRVLAERFAADPHLAIGPVTGRGWAVGPALGGPAPGGPAPGGPAPGGPAPAVHREMVLGFVRDLLGKPAAGPDDDFVDHGGNSLLAARLLWNVQTTFDVEVSMRSFFDRPTAAALADEVQRLLAAAQEDS